MTYEVDVYGETIKEDFEKLDNAFKKVHDQNFKQLVNIDGHTGRGEVKKMRHGINYMELSKYGDNKPDIISIPCHWDYAHMVQTQEDIKQVARELGIRITTRLSW